MYNKTCPGCGTELGKNELTPAGYLASKACGGESLKYRKDTYIRIGKLNYCANCASDFDAWSIRCAGCGKKSSPSGAVKLRGKMYCRDCVTKLGTDEPADIRGNKICLNLSKMARDLIKQCGNNGYSVRFVVPLTEKTPVLPLYVNHKHLHNYVLETEKDENFTGKYFHMMIRMFLREERGADHPMLITVQIDGFIADTSEDQRMKSGDIGYRFEGILLRPNGEMLPSSRASLYAKGLRYLGYITPGSVRLLGICPGCHHSLCFKSYNFPMMQAEPVYSDDGTDVYTLYDMDGTLDRENWKTEVKGKTFRCRNDFRCRYCGATYLDYSSNPTKSHYGLYGCAYLGHEVFRDS